MKTEQIPQVGLNLQVSFNNEKEKNWGGFAT